MVKYGTIWPGANSVIDSVARDTNGDGVVDGNDGASDDVGSQERWVDDGTTIATDHSGW